MAEEIVDAVGVNVPAQDLNGPQVAASFNYMDRYGEERDKRLGTGVRQYIDPSKSDQYKHFLEDPWVEKGTPFNRPVEANSHIKTIIVGGGFGGLLFAVRMIQKGFSVDDILIVEPAGGFGGTWYWNRYPGLMCDTESYIYLPLLEEMGYMPTRKYASGSEIRKYAESIATKDWKTVIVEKGKGTPKVEVSVCADYVLFASGVLANAKLPQVEGFDTFKGHSFHTARWDYAYTGGSPEEPDLTKLKDKRVAYIGTGATAIQSVPHLAKWSKELYIFQRTPSAVDRRDNRDTDPAKWKSEVATGEGWQRERSRNFHAFIGNAPEKPAVDLVDDEWTKMWSYSALCGSPRTVTMDGLGEYVKSLHEIDYPRSDRVRKRCEKSVRDQATAKALQAWYPG
ncbi:hypothetical protein B0A55_09042, partial [Friedmanniomyces simplex]